MPAPEVQIELRSLRVLARIGVTNAELEIERPLIIDIDLQPRAVAATETDQITDTVDYAAVAEFAERTATAEPHRTLERVAAEIADGLLARGDCERVEIRVAKPEPPMDQRVDHVAVRLTRTSDAA